jgi:glucoamylase
MSSAICPKRAVRAVVFSSLFFLICTAGLETGTFASTGRLDHGVSLKRGSSQQMSLEEWLNFESTKATKALLSNISPEGALLGSISASPSRENPNYYYHWVRDGALVMDIVVALYEKATNEAERGEFSKLLLDYVDFSLHIQSVPNFSGGLGEPKFRMDGTAYNDDWGRPQNDGPALRAITLTRFAQDLLASNQGESWVRAKLYDTGLPSYTLIKTDLEYVSHHWRESAFDLWEEVRGSHFYTKMVQRKALIEGAILADRMGDFAAAGWYRLQANQLEDAIDKHWSQNRGYLLETLDRMYGSVYKDSGLDVAVLLGVIHGNTHDGFYDITSDRVLATAYALRESFQKIYPINSRSDLAPAIGRYPEDIYNGYSVGDLPGNPWVLATHAYAELYFRLISAWNLDGMIHITRTNLPFFKDLVGGTRISSKFKADLTFIRGSAEFEQILNQAKIEGDRFLARVQLHATVDGALSEQMNRYTGFMQGARDLGWSYASFLTALWERQKLIAR